jgi:hypothetical protein
VRAESNGKGRLPLDREPTMAEMAETAFLLERAGLIRMVEDQEGREAYVLTTDGERVNRLKALARPSAVDAMLDALLAQAGE